MAYTCIHMVLCMNLICDNHYIFIYYKKENKIIQYAIILKHMKTELHMMYEIC